MLSAFVIDIACMWYVLDYVTSIVCNRMNKKQSVVRFILQEVCGIEGCGEPWTWGLLKILFVVLVWVFAGRSRMPLHKRGSCGWNTVVSMLTRICQWRCGHRAIVSNTLMDDLKLLSRAKHAICIKRQLQMLVATCNYYWLSTERWRKRRCQAWILDFT